MKYKDHEVRFNASGQTYNRRDAISMNHFKLGHIFSMQIKPAYVIDKLEQAGVCPLYDPQITEEDLDAKRDSLNLCEPNL